MKKDKYRVALISVFAALLLTGMKLVVGLATNSLGILSEAAHSGLDLGAAIMTLFAVSMSDRPADDTHHYGHGKIEGFSAFIEVLLLLLTCGWIIYEAVERLTGRSSLVDVNMYSFGVMAISIIVDYSRSRVLYKVAKRTKSQALEADALHFSSDIWSSAVVIVGLVAFKFFKMPLADSIAALVVSVLVIVVSIRLALRTIDVLLDRAPSDMRTKIYNMIRNVDGVDKVHRLRIRCAGSTMFVDLVLMVEYDLSIEEAHKISNHVEYTIEEAFPNTDVLVHLEPKGTGYEEKQNIKDTVSKILDEHKAMFCGYHDIDVTSVNKTHLINIHIEMDDSKELRESHSVCDHLERDIHESIPKSRVTIHVEPVKRG